MKAKVDKRKKYPWDKWFGQQQTVIQRGKDYKCMTHCMAIQVRAMASKWGVKVAIAIGNDGKSVTIIVKDK